MALLIACTCQRPCRHVQVTCVSTPAVCNPLQKLYNILQDLQMRPVRIGLSATPCFLLMWAFSRLQNDLQILHVALQALRSSLKVPRPGQKPGVCRQSMLVLCACCSGQASAIQLQPGPSVLPTFIKATCTCWRIGRPRAPPALHPSGLDGECAAIQGFP